MHTLREIEAWIGRELYDPYDERVGTIVGVRADAPTGAPTWLVVATHDRGAEARDGHLVPVEGAVPSGRAIRVPSPAARIRSAPARPLDVAVSVDDDRATAAHYGLVLDTSASATGIPRPPAATHDRAREVTTPPPSPALRAELVDGLQAAHAMERGVLQELATAIWRAEDEELVHDLKRHHAETERHAARLRRRLADLGEVRSPWRDELAKLRGRARTSRFRGRRSAGASASPLAIATEVVDLDRRQVVVYESLAALAARADDPATARLAVDHRADEEAMIATLTAGWPRLAEVDRRGVGAAPADPST